MAGCAGNINPDRQLEDAVLSASVLDAFAADRDLSRYDLVVDATGPVITLLGDLPSNSLRMRAETIAAAVEGVQSVVNEIRVRN